MKPEDMYNKFVDALLERIDACADNATPARLSIGMNGRDITIDIYPTSEGGKALDDAIKNAVLAAGAETHS